MGKGKGDKLDLSRYFSSSPKSIIGRVAPCLDEMVDKLEVVRCCCDLLAMEPDGDSDIKEGMSRILLEVINELYEASEVSRREIRKARKAAKKRKVMTIWELINSVGCEIQGSVEVRKLEPNSRDLCKVFSSDAGFFDIPDDIAKMEIVYLYSEPLSNGESAIVIDVRDARCSKE